MLTLAFSSKHHWSCKLLVLFLVYLSSLWLIYSCIRFSLRFFNLYTKWDKGLAVLREGGLLFIYLTLPSVTLSSPPSLIHHLQLSKCWSWPSVIENSKGGCRQSCFCISCSAHICPDWIPTDGEAFVIRGAFQSSVKLFIKIVDLDGWYTPVLSTLLILKPLQNPRHACSECCVISV